MDVKNTPFKSIQEKQIDTVRFKEKQMSMPKEEPKSLIEFKLNESILQQNPQQQKVSRMIYPSPYVPIQEAFPQNYPYVTGQPMYPFMYQPNNVPFINNYNVSYHMSLYKLV